MDYRTGISLSGTSGRHPSSQSSTGTAGYTYADMRCYQSPLHQTAAAVQRFRKSHQGVLVADYDHNISGSRALPDPANATADLLLPPRGNGRSFPGYKEIVWIVKHTASTTGATSSNAPAIPSSTKQGNARSNPGAEVIGALAKSAVPASSVDCDKTSNQNAADMGGLQEAGIRLVCAEIGA